ncbi:MAG: hypothetical protein V4519_03685 [Patescibacteria group bacterium]
MPTSNNKKDPASEIHQLRTYTDDIAELIRNNQLTPEQLAKIDPEVIKQAQNRRNLNNFGNFDTTTDGVTIDPRDQIVREEMKQPKAVDPKDKKPEQQEFKDNVVDLDDTTGESGVADFVLSLKDKAKPQQPTQAAPEPVVQQAPIAEPITEVEPPVQEIKPEPKVVAPEPKPEPVKELSPLEKLQKKEISLQDEVTSLMDQQKKLETDQATLESSLHEIDAKRQPLKAQEDDIEKQVRAIRLKESEVDTIEEKKALKQQRWSLEDERQRIEKERWDIDQSILTLTKQVQDIHSEQAKLMLQETEVEHAIDEVKKNERVLQAEIELKVMADKLKVILADRQKLEVDWKDIMDKKKVVLDKEAAIHKQEKVMQTEIDSIELKEHSAKDPSDLHIVEEQRWQKDKELRAIEVEEGAVQEELQAFNASVTEIETKSQSVLHQERELKDKIKELETIVAGTKK